MMTDIAKEPEPTTEHLLRRGRKRKVEERGGEASDNSKRHQFEGTREEREDELRQGRRVYKIQGTRQAGYNLNLRSTHKSGAGTIQMTEQEEPKSQGNGDLAEHTLHCLSTDEDKQDLWEALVDFWAGPLQDMEQEADIATAIDRTQAELARPTTASTESIPRQTTTTDSTGDQTETVSAETTKTDEESHTRSVVGLEKCKEEQVPKVVGKKRTRRRRSQLDDLTIGAPSLPQGNLTRSAVD